MVHPMGEQPVLKRWPNQGRVPFTIEQEFEKNVSQFTELILPESRAKCVACCLEYKIKCELMH